MMKTYIENAMVRSSEFHRVAITGRSKYHINNRRITAIKKIVLSERVSRFLVLGYLSSFRFMFTQGMHTIHFWAQAKVMIFFIITTQYFVSGLLKVNWIIHISSHVIKVGT